MRNILVKIIAIILVIAFLGQNVVWADSELSIINSHKLAQQTILTSGDKASEFERVVRFYVKHLISSKKETPTLTTVLEEWWPAIADAAIKRGLKEKEQPRIANDIINGFIKIIFPNDDILFFYDPNIYTSYTPSKKARPVNKYLTVDFLEAISEPAFESQMRRFGKVSDEKLRKEGYRYYIIQGSEKRYFHFRWNIFASLDDQIIGNIEEREWLAKVSDDIKKIQNIFKNVRGIKENISEDNVIKIEKTLKQILRVIGGVHVQLPDKQRAAGYIKAAKADYKAGKSEDLREAYRNLSRALTYLETRKKEIEHIYERLRDILRDARAWAGEMNTYMAGVAKSREIEKLYHLASRDEIKMPENEPEFEGLEALIREAIRHIESGHKGDSERTKANLERVEKEIKASNFLGRFIAEFKDAYFDARYAGAGESYGKKKFEETRLKYLKEHDIVRGSPAYWYARFYQAAFIHRTISNPEKPSERISNPLFEVSTILIQMLKIGNFDVILNTHSLLPKKSFFNLRAKIESFPDKKKSLYDLSRAEKRNLTRELAQEINLKRHDLVRLNKCAEVFLYGKKIIEAVIPPYEKRLSATKRLIMECGFDANVPVTKRIFIEKKLAQEYLNLVVTKEELGDLLTRFKESQQPISKLEDFLQKNILDYFLANATQILHEVETGEPFEKEKVHELFMAGIRVYKFPLIKDLIKKRKELLSVFLVLNIRDPKAKVGSLIRSNEARKLMISKVFASKDKTVFQPALEVVIELIAQGEIAGNPIRFNALYPLLKESGRLRRFGKALVDVRIKAERGEIQLVIIKDIKDFIKQNERLIKQVAHELPSVGEELVEYIFSKGQEDKTLLPLMERLLKIISEEPTGIKPVSGKEIKKFVNEINPHVQRALRKETRIKPENYRKKIDIYPRVCSTASIVAKSLLEKKFGDAIKKMEMKIMIKSQPHQPKKLKHSWLEITTCDEKKYLLSFVDGYFEPGFFWREYPDKYFYRGHDINRTNPYYLKWYRRNKKDYVKFLDITDNNVYIEYIENLRRCTKTPQKHTKILSGRKAQKYPYKYQMEQAKKVLMRIYNEAPQFKPPRAAGAAHFPPRPDFTFGQEETLEELILALLTTRLKPFDVYILGLAHRERDNRVTGLRVRYKGKNGSYVEGFIPQRYMFGPAEEYIKKKIVGEKIKAYLVRMQYGFKPIFALNLQRVRAESQALEELEQARDNQEKVKVTVKGRSRSDKGWNVIYKTIIRGFLPDSSLPSGTNLNKGDVIDVFVRKVDTESDYIEFSMEPPRAVGAAHKDEKLASSDEPEEVNDFLKITLNIDKDSLIKFLRKDESFKAAYDMGWTQELLYEYIKEIVKHGYFPPDICINFVSSPEIPSPLRVFQKVLSVNLASKFYTPDVAIKKAPWFASHDSAHFVLDRNGYSIFDIQCPKTPEAKKINKIFCEFFERISDIIDISAKGATWTIATWTMLEEIATEAIVSSVFTQKVASAIVVPVPERWDILDKYDVPYDKLVVSGLITEPFSQLSDVSHSNRNRLGQISNRFYKLALDIIKDKEKHEQILNALREFYNIFYEGDILGIKEKIISKTAYNEKPSEPKIPTILWQDIKEIEKNVEKIVPRLVNSLMTWTSRAKGPEDKDRKKARYVVIFDMPPAQSEEAIDLFERHIIKPLTRVDDNNDAINKILDTLDTYGRDKINTVRERIANENLDAKNVIIMTDASRVARFEKGEFEDSFKTALATGEDFDWERQYYPYIEAAFFAIMRVLEYNKTDLFKLYKQIPNIKLKEINEEKLMDLCFDENGNPKKSVILYLIPKAKKFDDKELEKLYKRIEEFIRKA